MKPAVCVLLLTLVSVHGRIAVKDVNVSDELKSNLINENTKIVKTLPPGNIDDLPHEKLAGADSANKTCHSGDLDVDNTIEPSENKPCEDEVEVDNGTALMLTPFIEEGRLEEARNASRVNSEPFLGIESYTGFLTVDKQYKSHLFFWYFPALKPANDTPWIIWLQGGPGASSLTGLFDEIGPFQVNDDGTLRRNPYTWLHNHSLVFIDNPVGTGYSFTEHKDGYTTDMHTYGKHLHEAVKQLVQMFPQLRTAPLYVAGESYAGKYVPALGTHIHRHKDSPGGDLNLKGLIIGNGFVEPNMISQIVRSFYYFSLLEAEQIEIIKPLVDGFQGDIAANRSVEAKQKWMGLVSVLLTLSHQKHAYNFLRDDLGVGSFISVLMKPEIKRDIHVGDIKFSFINVTVNTKLAPDFLSSTKPLFEELLENYRVLAYCGQLDQMLPCAISSDSYRTWTWNASKDFTDAPRHPFILNRKVAGYFKTGGGLTWAVIRGAGHMVPLDAPAAAFRLVSLWTHHQPLPTVHSHIDDMIMSFIQNSTNTVYL